GPASGHGDLLRGRDHRAAAAHRLRARSASPAPAQAALRPARSADRAAQEGVLREWPCRGRRGPSLSSSLGRLSSPLVSTLLAAMASCLAALSAFAAEPPA